MQVGDGLTTLEHLIVVVNINNLAQTTIVVLTALGSLGIAVGWVIRRIRRSWRYVKTALELIKFQMEPNGGGSLIDKVNHIVLTQQSAENYWRILEDLNVRFKDVDRTQREYSRLLQELLLTQTPERRRELMELWERIQRETP